MYSVYLSNKGQEPLLIFDDRFPTPETALISPSLDIESGRAGSFDATLPPTNQGYSAIEAMKTELIVKKNSKEVWRGRVLNPSTDFYNQMRIEVEGELTYLTDTFQPQHEYKTETLRQVIEGILSIHNQKVSGANEPFDKTFYVGTVFVSDGDPTGTDKSYRTTDYDTTLNCLKKIGDAYKGYFIVKHGEDGKRYLDFVKEFNITSSQRIDFGENLLDFTKSFKMEDLCTVAMPIGGRVQDTDFTEADEMYIYLTEDNRGINYLSANDWQTKLDPNDQYRHAGVVYFNEYGLHAGDKVYVSLYNRPDTAEDPKDGMWAFSGPHGIPSGSEVTHRTAQDGEYETVTKKALTIPEGADRLRIGWYSNSEFSPKVYKQKAESQLDEHFTIAPYGAVDNTEFKHTPGDIYLIYKPLYEKYGWHEKKLEFSNLEKSEDLWNMATYWLTHTQFEQMVLEVTAFDLSMMNVSYGDIWINMNVPIYSKPHGLTNNLLLPCTKMSIKLGSPENTQYTLGYTTPAAISDTQSNVNADLSKLMNEVPTYSDTFKAIQDNSTAIINAMYGSGYVSFLHNIPGNPNPISDIVITDVEDPSLATWKWVWNGGGLAYQYLDEHNQWVSKTAMTKDGTIMGDMIAAHTIFADRMWGGTLELGHVPKTDPVTGITEYNDGDLKVLANDGHRVAAIENVWGITSESEDRIVRHDNQTEYNDGVQVRVRNGYIYGGFKNQVGDTSRVNEYNGITIQGEACTGSVQFYNGYGLDGQRRFGVDVVGRVFGIRSDYICFTNTYDTSSQGHQTFVGQSGIFKDANGYKLHFVHGLLAEVEQPNNGGE